VRGPLPLLLLLVLLVPPLVLVLPVVLLLLLAAAAVCRLHYLSQTALVHLGQWWMSCPAPHAVL
jgi:hypothetical protein